MAEKNLAKKKTETTALGHSFDYGEMAGGGWENTGSDDFTIPFLAIIQAMSPQLSETEAGFIDGAKAGMLLNTASQEIIDGKEGIEFVPCLTQHVFVEWRNRQTDGGGFIAVHESNTDVVKDAKNRSTQFGKYTIPVDGGVAHDLVETFYIYGLLVKGDEIVSPCMISFSSTKIKAYKGIMTPLRQVKGRPPLFAFKLRVTTVADKNKLGSFFNFKLLPAAGSALASLMAPDHPFVLAGKEFKDQVADGKARVDHSGGSAGDGSGDEPDAPF